jgi:opacity protein-like surface antigen
MKHSLALVLLAAVLPAFTPAGTTGVQAQLSTTRGFNLGVYLEGAQISVEGEDPSGGGGLGLRAGYGVNRIITLFLNIDGTAIEVDDPANPSGDWQMAHFDLGARFHFANTLRRWVPYLEAAISGRAVSLDDARLGSEQVGKLTFSGSALTIGGGLSIYLKEALALDIELLGSGGTFNQIDVGAISVSNLDLDATSGRFKVGLIWWP